MKPAIPNRLPSLSCSQQSERSKAPTTSIMEDMLGLLEDGKMEVEAAISDCRREVVRGDALVAPRCFFFSNLD